MRGIMFLAVAIAVTAPAAGRQASPAPFDHSGFDALLRAHVVRGLVDYDAFAAAPEFKAYLDRLYRADPGSGTEPEQMAYWINVYNAFTIEQVNAHGERNSIRNIHTTLGLLPLKGPWSEEMVRAAGRVWTLDQVEHEIIRKRFKEPRIHFALVCAALSCPPLRNEAYVAARLDAQLDDQARTFLLESPGKNRVEAKSGVANLSPIFVWYKEDFGGTDAALGRYLARFHPAGPERRLLESGRFELRQTPYDWTLNSQEQGGAAGRKGTGTEPPLATASGDGATMGSGRARSRAGTSAFSPNRFAGPLQ